eukprot:6289866-Alexandrium_andersonii.AAC.1
MLELCRCSSGIAADQWSLPPPSAVRAAGTHATALQAVFHLPVPPKARARHARGRSWPHGGGRGCLLYTSPSPRD